MNFLEKDLEQIIWESDNSKLQQKNLEISGKKFRQLRIGNYGILDLMTVEKTSVYCYSMFERISCLNITVYELKKEKVGISAFLQAVKYCKGIQSYMKKRKPNIHFQLNIILIAKNVDNHSDFIYLTDLLNHKYSDSTGVINSIDNYSFHFDIDGILFEKHEGYDLKTKGF